MIPNPCYENLWTGATREPVFFYKRRVKIYRRSVVKIKNTMYRVCVCARAERWEWEPNYFVFYKIIRVLFLLIPSERPLHIKFELTTFRARSNLIANFCRKMFLFILCYFYTRNVSKPLVGNAELGGQFEDLFLNATFEIKWILKLWSKIVS